jgi:nucleotide-binding universal stress UspA family protein
MTGVVRTGKEDVMTAGASGAGRVVVGVDGSPASMAAIGWAAREARAHGLPLHVVHVRDPEGLPLAHYAPMTGDSQASAGTGDDEAALKAMTEEAAGSDPLAAVQLEVVDGLPARVLLDRSAEAEMLVLGSSRPAEDPDRHTGQPRDPLGPVARTCVRAAQRPVVIVRPPAPGR